MLGERRTASTRWSRRWRCASSPTATRTCTSRLLTDFHDADEDMLPADAALLERARSGDRRAQREVRRRARRRRVLPVPSAAALERARGRLDGLRAQARQARRAQRAAARRRARRVSRAIVGDTDALRGRAVRDHARHRHAAAARRGARARRHDGASAEPRRASTTQRRRVTARLRHPAAARRRAACRARTARGTRGCSAASRASIRTRARCRTCTRTCSAKARSSARASTTSMRSSARSADRFPENRILSHDLLEGCYARAGLVSDVQLLRGLSRRATRRREPPPPLDPRRLADRCRGCCRACRAPDGARRAQSAVGAVALEDPRQPAPQPGAGGGDRAAGARLGCWCRRRWHWTLVAAVACCCCRSLVPTLRDVLAKPTDMPLATHLLQRAASLRPRSCSAPRFTLACLPYEAFFSLDAIVRTLWRMLRHPPPAAGVESVQRSGAHAWAAAAGAELRSDVDRAGVRASPSRRCCATSHPAALPVAAADRWCCGSSSPALAWWLSRPLRARAARDCRRRRRAFLRTARAPDLGVLRDLRRAPRTTGCRPTTIQEHPVAVVAHRTSPTNIGLALLANLAAHDFGYLHGRRS